MELRNTEIQQRDTIEQRKKISQLVLKGTVKAPASAVSDDPFGIDLRSCLRKIQMY